MKKHVYFLALYEACQNFSPFLSLSSVDHLDWPTFIPLLIPYSIKSTLLFLATLRATLSTLSNLNIPTISAVAGDAHGGGLELALATDLRVFSTTAKVSLPETRLGIIPGAGGTYRLRSIIGESRALDLILTGRKLTGADAYSIGLCQRIVRAPPGKSWDIVHQRVHNPAVIDSGKRQETLLEVSQESRAAVLEESFNLAQMICEGAPLAINAALAAVKVGTKAAEEERYADVMGTRDRDRALEAFPKKEAPKFKGD